MLYATIVQRKIKHTFREINQGNVQPMLDTLADPFVYVFHGTHALGGRRTSKDAMRLWWERVFRLLPGIRFDVQEVVINGWPWNTRVAVRSLVSGDLPKWGVVQQHRIPIHEREVGTNHAHRNYGRHPNS